jgi:uncharacterized membrane protein YczE
LVIACAVLGTGVALLLRAALGSDGFSTLVNGISIASGVSFFLVNFALGVGFVAIAWLRGLRPGWGTIVQPVVVGGTINLLLDVIAPPHGLPVRIALLVVAFPILILGVSGYLGSGAGAGPTEAVVLAFDPPVPFRWSYSVLQGGGALLGWAFGAAIGVGTLLVIFLLGPAVDLMASRVRFLDIHASGLSAADVPCPQP